MSVQQLYRHVLLAALGFAPPAFAQHAGTPADKSGYHLFNPTPRALLRELATDRPDTTESPFTVDAGHVQLELSFVDFSMDDDDGIETRSLAIAPLLLRVGVLNDVELALGLDPYTRATVEDETGETTVDGFGDTVLRAKFNLWGNDEGDTALAVMPYIKFPTADDDFGNGNIEGGIIMPFGMALDDDWSLGLMGEIDFIRNPADDRYVTDFLHTATVSRPIVGDLSGFLEYAGIINLNGAEDYRASFNSGLTYALCPDAQLDAGVRVGLTDATEDLGLFAGLSFRY